MAEKAGWSKKRLEQAREQGMLGPAVRRRRWRSAPARSRPMIVRRRWQGAGAGALSANVVSAGGFCAARIGTEQKAAHIRIIDGSSALRFAQLEKNSATISTTFDLGQEKGMGWNRRREIRRAQRESAEMMM